MRLESALRTSREGIAAHGQAIAVIGDNISNANTPAFKKQRAEFVDLLSERENDRTSEVLAGVGDGVTIGQVRVNFESGSLLSTGRELDVALSGRGFFLVGDVERPQLTRLGNFRVNDEGLLATADGAPILGYSGVDLQVLGPINMLQLDVEPVATTEVTVFGNLDGATAATQIPQNPATFKELAAAASFVTTQSVYDALGERHDVQVFYFKNQQSQWTAQAYVNGSEVGQAAEQPVLLGEANLTFNNAGVIAPENQAQAVLNLNPVWGNGAAQTPFTLSLANFTQYGGGGSRITNLEQNGRGNGDIVAYEVFDDGRVFATLNTGDRVQAGTLAIGLVNNVDGLERQGNSFFAVTEDSGPIEVGRAMIGGRGSMAGGALESSNVDLPEQFTDMIIIQRGYQASSQVLSTANDLIKNTIAMIR